jgi:hypothetical protein
LSASKNKSFNTCKRAGVSGHIPKVIGNMGVEYNPLWEDCESIKTSQREEIHIVGGRNFLVNQVFAWEGGQREER